MFSAIAPRYDLLNHLLSLNIDRSWRRRAINELAWESRPEGVYLDLCTGTYDLALELTRRDGFGGHVVAADFSRAMLRAGLTKLEGHPIAPACADALRSPFAAATFDGAMAAFGIRNLADIEVGLREILRILRPGARLVILDFAMPTRQPLKSLYRIYFTRMLPSVGRLISKHSFAYRYLPESVMRFAEPASLGELMSRVGFKEVEWQTLTGGIACVWRGCSA
jgi:demethylmenaquinone methyltransferase/2-methoxy-6-polyprenyl-1,4-benzoquinol methylase